MSIPQCTTCRSYDLRYDEVIRMVRCMSCWTMQFPVEAKHGRSAR